MSEPHTISISSSTIGWTHENNNNTTTVFSLFWWNSKLIFNTVEITRVWRYDLFKLNSTITSLSSRRHTVTLLHCHRTSYHECCSQSHGRATSTTLVCNQSKQHVGRDHFKGSKREFLRTGKFWSKFRSIFRTCYQSKHEEKHNLSGRVCQCSIAEAGRKSRCFNG